MGEKEEEARKGGEGYEGFQERGRRNSRGEENEMPPCNSCGPLLVKIPACQKLIFLSAL